MGKGGWATWGICPKKRQGERLVVDTLVRVVQRADEPGEVHVLQKHDIFTR